MAADLAFVGGAVFEALGAAPRSLAVTVKDGRIAGVGSDDEIRDEIDASTEVVDVGGGLLTPGFVDAHVHPVYAGYAMLRCELHDVIEADECISTVGAYARANPDVPWITGGGWSMASFPGGHAYAATAGWRGF